MNPNRVCLKPLTQLLHKSSQSQAPFYNNSNFLRSICCTWATWSVVVEGLAYIREMTSSMCSLSNENTVHVQEYYRTKKYGIWVKYWPDLTLGHWWSSFLACTSKWSTYKQVPKKMYVICGQWRKCLNIVFLSKCFFIHVANKQEMICFLMNKIIKTTLLSFWVWNAKQASGHSLVVNTIKFL